MCKPHNASCFSDEEKTKLKKLEWTDEQIKFAEDSVIEDKVKELIK